MDIWQFKIPTEDLLKVSSIAHQTFFFILVEITGTYKYVLEAIHPQRPSTSNF